MSGSVEGGKAAATTNKQRHGEDFYKRIGALGGKKSAIKGFAWMKATGQIDKIKAAGAKGGAKSKRGKANV